ncbi:MAG: hypothetical protein QM296_07960 [Bacillota bacterium]|nr:hypothetical protein [Bacillota bacterium]
MTALLTDFWAGFGRMFRTVTGFQVRLLALLFQSYSPQLSFTHVQQDGHDRQREEQTA